MNRCHSAHTLVTVVSGAAGTVLPGALALLTLLLVPLGTNSLRAESPPAIETVTADSVLVLAQKHDGPVLVNVWATWCRPCREEMPELLRLHRDHEPDGFKLLLVSADFARQKAQVREYLQGLGVDFPVYLKQQNDQEFINTLDPEWSGALPLSILFSSNGQRVQTWYGVITHATADSLISAILAKEENEKNRRSHR